MGARPRHDWRGSESESSAYFKVVLRIPIGLRVRSLCVAQPNSLPTKSITSKQSTNSCKAKIMKRF